MMSVLDNSLILEEPFYQRNPKRPDTLSTLYMSLPHLMCLAHRTILHVTRVNESCHMYEGVMSHIRLSHFTHEWVMSHMNLSRNESGHIAHIFMARMWMSHVTHENETCRTGEWVMVHMYMGHVNESRHTHVNESCSRCEGVMAHARMRQSHICEWLMSHTWMGHATHVGGSRDTCE